MPNSSFTVAADPQDLLPERFVRPFGSAFAGQSRAYLIGLPLLLTVAGLFAWAIPNNATFVMGSFVGALVSLYILLDIVFRRAPIRLSLLLTMTLLIAYNLGSLNSWLTVPRANLTVAEYFARDPAMLARAVGACMVASALLLFLGQLYERPVFGENFQIRFDGGSTALICISTALVLFTYLTGKIGFMGAAVDDYGKVSPLAALVIWWSAPAFAYSVCAAFNTRGMSRFVVAFCALVQGVALIPIGRRIFAFGILLAMIATRLGKYRIRLSSLQKLAVCVIGSVLVVTASVGFVYLRVAVWGHKGNYTLRQRIEFALNLAHSRSPADILQMLQQNSSTRTFDIGYFSDLLDASQRSTPLLGADLVHNLQLMVPTAISADKFGLSMYGEEDMANMRWGFSYTDEANTLLTAGAADFGIVGVLLYPLIAVLLLRTFLEWVQYVTPSKGAVLIALAFIHQMLLAEQLPAGYLIQIRNSLILMGILYVVSIMPKFRLRAPE
jgi:hypothetical protein